MSGFEHSTSQILTRSMIIMMKMMTLVTVKIAMIVIIDFNEN